MLEMDPIESETQSSKHSPRLIMAPQNCKRIQKYNSSCFETLKRSLQWKTQNSISVQEEWCIRHSRNSNALGSIVRQTGNCINIMSSVHSAKTRDENRFREAFKKYGCLFVPKNLFFAPVNWSSPFRPPFKTLNVTPNDCGVANGFWGLKSALQPLNTLLKCWTLK